MELERNAFVELIREPPPPPCVSIFMPIYREPFAAQQNPVRLKNLLRDAKRRIEETDAAREADGLLAPGFELVKDEGFWKKQRAGLCLYLAPEFTRWLSLHYACEELVVVSDRFHVRPTLSFLNGEDRFFVLALSQGKVRLLSGNGSEAVREDVPDLLESLERFTALDDPGKQLQYHTGTTGDRSPVYHGQGAGTDDSDAKLRGFLHAVEDAVSRHLSGQKAPLLVAAVDEMVHGYRRANRYSHLVEEHLAGNHDDASDRDLVEKARSALSGEFDRPARKALETFRRVSGEAYDLSSNRLRTVLPAARDGRVKMLLVPRETRVWGRFEPESKSPDVHENPGPGDEDLLDLAVSECLRHGGDAYAVGSEQLSGEPVAAVFRYA